MRPEALRVAALRRVLLERPLLVVGLVERAPCGAEPAHDLGEQREEARVDCASGLCERTLPGPFEAALAAAHRERHLGGLYPDTQFAEQPRQERVVGLVVDDEAGVERKAFVVHRAHVAPRRARALEDGDVVRAREHVGGPEAAHARSDDGDPHRVLFVLGAPLDVCGRSRRVP